MLRRVAVAVALHHPPPPPRSRTVGVLCTRRHLCAAVRAVDLTAVRDFWEQKGGGLTQQRVSRLVAFGAKRPSLRQPAKLQEKLDGLCSVLGLDEPAVVRMAATDPHLLTFAAPTKNKSSAVAANFRALRAQFSSFDVLKLVQRHPQLLSVSKSTLERKLSALAELLPGVDVVSKVHKCPQLLNMKVDTIRAKAKGLMEQFSREDALRMIEKQPFLLTSNSTGTVAPNFDRFREVFGAECARRVCRTQPQLLGLDFHGTVVPKISELARLLECSEPEARELLERLPHLLTLNISNLGDRAEALVQMFRELGSDTPKEDFRALVHRLPMVIRNRPRLMAHRVERLLALTGSKERARDTILTCPTVLTKGLGVWNRLAFAKESRLRLGISTVLSIPAATLAKRLPGYHDFLIARANAQWLDCHSQLRQDTRFRVHLAKRLLPTNVQPTPSEIATALDSLPQAFANLKLSDLELTVNDMELLHANTTAPTTVRWGQ